MDLCRILIQEGINVNQVNEAGHSPLTIFMQGERGANRVITRHNIEGVVGHSIFDLLADGGANMNHCYPEEHVKQAGYKCSILVNYVRHSN